MDINRGPLLREGVEAHPLTPRQVEQKRAAGALVVDVRTALQFDEAHLPDSVSIPAVQAGFGTKLSWLADRAQEVVLIGRDDEDGIRAALLAAAVGITRIGGYLAGGMTSWREEKRGTDRIERIDVPALHERLEQRSRTCRSSTCASRRNGTSATSRARSSPPTTTCAASRTGSTPAADRRDLQLGAAQRRGGQPAAAPRGARPSCTWSTAASAPGPAGLAGRGGRAAATTLARLAQLLARLAIFSGVAEQVDLNVVCKNCGSEVSPYITECPYCGQRLRKRAPKLRPEGESAELAPAKKRRRRFARKPREERLPLVAVGEPPVRHDRDRAGERRASTSRTTAATSALYDLGAIIGPLDGDWWRLVAANFVYENVGYLFAVALAIAIFGTSLERRYGAPVLLLIFLAGGAAGMYVGERGRELPARDGRQRRGARRPRRVGDPRPARPPRRRGHRDATCSA